jgi:hypothetical protein
MKTQNVLTTFVVLLFGAVAWLFNAPQAVAGSPNQLKLAVNSVEVATKFVVYVGGGANISPPSTFGGGGGILMISFSNNGPAFMAGEVSAKEKTKLIKITLAITNTAQNATSFNIGDVGLDIGFGKLNDFFAVGYGSQLCSMSDEDRKKVKEIVVTVAPAETRSLSFVFPLFNADAKHGEVLLSGAAPAPFNIGAK